MSKANSSTRTHTAVTQPPATERATRKRPATERQAVDRKATPAELQHRIEQFLYREAMLLDAWRLDEWLALFTDDARYVVPSTEYPQGNPPEYPALIDDDLTRLKGRVARLTSRHAFREYPYSRTRHIISNVLVTGVTGEDVAGEGVAGEDVSVTAPFVVYRVKNRKVTQYIGRYLYTLARSGDDFKIRHKRSELDLEGLWEQGTVSILL